MNTASDVFKSLVVVALAAGMLNVASGATTTPAAAAPASGTTAAANNAAMKNLKKLLSTVDPNQLADAVTRFIYCASHHHKALQNVVTPALAEWNACGSKQPSDWEAQVACFLKSANNLATFVALGHQISSIAGCFVGANATDVLCVKKVQKSEECANMCTESHSSQSETAVIAVVAVPPTVRKDDCKLTSKGGVTPANSNLTASLDFTMKVLQCLPSYFGDSYQHLLEHIKLINTCTQQYEDNWYNWAKCVVEAHDIKLVSPYFVKSRQTVACVIGGDIPAQTVCVRNVKNAEECRSCGGQDLHPVESVPPLGATNNCV
ncbi:uncharacterized protein LOC117654173 isoform X1 [Thrips palmi]|uniref:Uncharacterized protein LOC117654173 isoform X1 n=1 Tax=Thrips palmi TaxID=161013 RepID=A0A6P9ADG2_THRPL|nr:uncharacterized protein LOC117654173 isoform X1 [Thrips palmi]